MKRSSKYLKNLFGQEFKFHVSQSSKQLRKRFSVQRSAIGYGGGQVGHRVKNKSITKINNKNIKNFQKQSKLKRIKPKQ